jgi:Ca-activated chloride channel family protein
MLHFEWVWLGLLLPLPLLVRWLAPAAKQQSEAALRVPFMDDFAVAAGSRMRRRVPRLPLLLALLAWVFLVLSAMRPEWLGEAVEIPVSGRSMMLAVDLSGSMQEEDFVLHGQRVDRLTALKWVAGDFIERRAGDRLGLILFGSQAYLQAPLTFDRETVRTLLFESAIGLAGRATAIGDAIGLAVKRLREYREGERVLILLTDGANTAGVVDPLDAARLAAREGIRIHTVGIGADEMLIRDFFGARRVNPSSDLDEEALRSIAEVTGGRYFRARDSRELEAIHHVIDRIEPVQSDPKLFRPRTPLFHWPLAAALAIAAALGLSHLGVPRRRNAV